MKRKDEQEIEVNLFCGAGGASLGMLWAIGREPHICVNHDEQAILMHAVNHPLSVHYTEDVRNVSPKEVVKGRPVGAIWLSPDCTGFSRAKGAVPVENKIRSLPWVTIRWAREVRPRVILLENVPELISWGSLIPLVVNGRPQKLLDGRPAMVPNPATKGRSFKQWIGRLRALGYVVEWRVLNAADFGSATKRLRFFLIARCDGEPIVWPTPTHSSPKKPLPNTKPWRSAAECIDWSIPVHSIFLSKEEGQAVNVRRPLAENTLRRIALGVKRYVLENPKPFLVQVNHGGEEFRGQSIDDPLSTITGKHGYGVVVPHIIKFRGESKGSSIEDPLPTITSGSGSKRPAGAAHAMGMVSAFLARLGQTGGNGAYSQDANAPITTITSKAEHLLVAAHLVPHFGERPGQEPRAHSVEEPMPTVTGQGAGSLTAALLVKHYGGPHNKNISGQGLDQPIGTITQADHHSLVAANLVRFNHDDAGVPIDQPLPTITSNNHAALVYAFLTKYYKCLGPGQDLTEPLHTVRSGDTFGLVTVTIEGEPWVIVDIGMRMLTPRELATAQGFPPTFHLCGSKSNQVAKIGNSVCPQNAAAVVAANYKPRKRSTKA